MRKDSFFEKPLFRTKITSANVKTKEMLLGYFVGPFCALISNAIFSSYLNRYYADVIGWTDTGKFGSFSALLPMVSVIFVILGNLFVGRLIDNTRTSQGKARPYLLLSAPLVTAAIALLFMTPQNTSPLMQMVWIAVSYNVYYAVAYPFYYSAHSSLVALSTRNSNHRGMLATFSNASGVAAVGIGASILVPILLQSYLFVETNGVLDSAASYRHWQTVMIALCVLTFFAILLEYYFTRERITEENVKLNLKEEKLPMAQQIKACVSEKYWWIIILYFLLFQFGGLVKNGSMSFYCRWMFDGVTTEAAAGGLMGTLGLIGGIPTAVGMVLAWPIANKLGKQKAVTYGLIISVLGGLVSFINVHNFMIVCIGVILKGIGSIPAMYVTLALLSDVLDHLEAKNGFRSDGFTMPVMAIDFWGDASVLVPWAMYQANGDVQVLKDNYEMMKKYVRACKWWAGLLSFGDKRYIWHTPSVLHFGDWVAPDVPQMSQWQKRSKWTATASLANTSGILSEIAGILGEEKDAKEFREISKNTAKAYSKILMKEDGHATEEFQTAYVLPLHFNMLEGAQKENAAKALVELVEKGNYCIGTGFPGTPYILFALADNGYVDVAYKMLLNEVCPSWLYEVKSGATTIWERWDGLDENGNCPIGDDGTDMMISYNHYASGAGGD